jgi:hypothetical protein
VSFLPFHHQRRFLSPHTLLSPSFALKYLSRVSFFTSPSLRRLYTSRPPSPFHGLPPYTRAPSPTTAPPPSSPPPPPTRLSPPRPSPDHDLLAILAVAAPRTPPVPSVCECARLLLFYFFFIISFFCFFLFTFLRSPSAFDFSVSHARDSFMLSSPPTCEAPLWRCAAESFWSFWKPLPRRETPGLHRPRRPHGRRAHLHCPCAEDPLASATYSAVSLLFRMHGSLFINAFYFSH